MAPSLQLGSSDTMALHMGHVVSLSNHVATHSSQKMCLQCSIVGSHLYLTRQNTNDVNLSIVYLSLALLGVVLHDVAVVTLLQMAASM